MFFDINIFFDALDPFRFNYINDIFDWNNYLVAKNSNSFLLTGLTGNKISTFLYSVENSLSVNSTYNYYYNTLMLLMNKEQMTMLLLNKPVIYLSIAPNLTVELQLLSFLDLKTINTCLQANNIFVETMHSANLLNTFFNACSSTEFPTNIRLIPSSNFEDYILQENLQYLGLTSFLEAVVIKLLLLIVFMHILITKVLHQYIFALVYIMFTKIFQNLKRYSITYYYYYGLYLLMLSFNLAVLFSPEVPAFTAIASWTFTFSLLAILGLNLRYLFYSPLIILSLSFHPNKVAWAEFALFTFEVLSHFITFFSLGLRLFTNMLTGSCLLKTFTSAILGLFSNIYYPSGFLGAIIFWWYLPLFLFLVFFLYCLESLVTLIQIYVFIILSKTRFTEFIHYEDLANFINPILSWKHNTIFSQNLNYYFLINKVISNRRKFACHNKY